MQEAGVRAQLEAIIQREVPEEVWGLLIEDGYVQEVLAGVEDSEDSLQRMVRRTRQYLKLMNERGESQPRELVPKKGSRLRDRMRAVTRLLAHEASKHPWVETFRQEVLNNQLLDPSEVEEWVLNQYEAQEGITYWATEVQLPIGTMILQEPKSGYLFTDPPFVIDETRPAIGRVEVRHLSYVVPGDPNPRYVPIAAGSALGPLWRLSEKLEQTFGWKKTQGVMFVLTGEAPLVPPAWLMPDFRTPFEVTSRITIEIDPAVSPSEVAEFYRQARREVISGRYRTLSEKHLQLAMFLASRPNDESWAERLRIWNESFPQWAYEPGQVKNFNRDCLQARERLLHPSYKNPLTDTTIESPWHVVDVKRKDDDG